MYMSAKDMLIYGVLGLTTALVINHYAGLDIPFLNKIEGAIVSSSDGLGSSVYVSPIGDPDSDCFDGSKVSGDARASLRQQIERAGRAGNWEKQRELEARLSELIARENAGCQ